MTGRSPQKAGGPRVFRTADGYEVEALLHAAVDHLASARVLFNTDFRCYDSAGYLAHLGLELLLKAVLLQATGQFPAQHSLRELLGLVRTAYPALSIAPADLPDRIADFEDLRYPLRPTAPNIGSGDWVEIERLFVELVENLPVEQSTYITQLSAHLKAGRILMTKRRLPGSNPQAP